MWPGTEAGGSREVMEARLRAQLLPGRPPPASSEQSTLGAGSPRDNGAVVAVPVLLQRSAESSSSLHDIHNYLLSDEDSGDNLMEGAGPLPDGRKATLAQSSLNLFNSIVGAGEMALPVSFSVLGIAGGSLALLLISAIMSDSIFTLVRVSVLRRQTTYGDVVGVYLGRWGAALVRVSLILTCLGFLISYTIIYGDLLVGDNQEGLLPSWMGHEKGPLPWYLHKQLVVGITVALLVFPLTCLRSLERLASASLFKFIISLAYTAATVLTLVAAVRSDAYKPVRLWPDIAAFSAAPVSQITKLVAVLPVVLTAYSCHFNVHPLMHELENFTEGRMMTVVHTGLQTSTLVFAVVGISGYVCFGDGVSADVLQNYTTEYLAPFFGHEYAMMVVGVLKLGYFALLVCTFPLLNWPFRENILELMGIKEADMGTPFFCGVSAVLVALVYCIATTVPTIWQALSLMGSTSAVMVIFIFPGAVQFLSARDRFDVRGNARHQWWQCRLREARGATLVILGVIVGTCGVYSALTDDRLSQSTTLFRGDWTMVAPLRSTQ